eukprot:11503-Heterococcus_DN1.PRE.2
MANLETVVAIGAPLKPKASIRAALPARFTKNAATEIPMGTTTRPCTCSTLCSARAQLSGNMPGISDWQ